MPRVQGQQLTCWLTLLVSYIMIHIYQHEKYIQLLAIAYKHIWDNHSVVTVGFRV